MGKVTKNLCYGILLLMINTSVLNKSSTDVKMNKNLTKLPSNTFFHNKTPSLAVFASKFVFTKKQSIVGWIFYDRFGDSEMANLGRHFYNEQLVVKLLSGTAKCHRCEILHRTFRTECVDSKIHIW